MFQNSLIKYETNHDLTLTCLIMIGELKLLAHHQLKFSVDRGRL